MDAELRVSGQRVGGVFDRIRHLIGILVVQHTDADHVVREVLGLVGQRLDLAVREDVNGAFLVPEDGRPEVDGLDEPTLPVDDGDVADAHLILEDQEKTGDDVAHQRLRAEADGEPDDAGAGERRGGIHAQLAERRESGDDDDDDRQ